MLDFTKEFEELKIFKSILWYILATFIVVITFSICRVFGFKNLPLDDNTLSLLSTILFILILLYKFKISKNKLSLLFNDYLRKINLKEIFSVVITQLLLSMGISFLLIGIIYFYFPDVLDKILSQSSSSDISNYYQLIIAMLASVICAPLAEELFFRSIVFKRISRKFNVYIGMIFSSLIFGSLHMELAIIGAFLFGIACCILYIKYKNILIPMTIHFLNNLIAFIPQLNINSSSTNSTITASDAKYSIIFGSILFIVSMILFIKFIFYNKKYLKTGFSPRKDDRFSIENIKLD